MTRPRIDAMAVVVPVRNEQDLLDGCLGALSIAVDSAAAAGIRCTVRIVLDACTDDSALIARRYPFPVIASQAGRVGAARRSGVAQALRSLAGTPAERIWIANTDADSRVPPGWLTHQYTLSAAADVYIGTVRPDFTDLSRSHRELWLDTHTSGRPNGHVHGANLGIRASTYLAAGGFAAIGEHEDVDLVTRCRARGAVAIASDVAEVVTSGRQAGRTPGGYAGYLHRQAVELAGEDDRAATP